MDSQICYENLANAVVSQAAKDYRYILRKLKKKPKDSMTELEKSALEKFFLSDDYRRFTTLDGKTLIRRLREEVYR